MEDAWTPASPLRKKSTLKSGISQGKKGSFILFRVLLLSLPSWAGAFIWISSLHPRLPKFSLGARAESLALRDGSRTRTQKGAGLRKAQKRDGSKKGGERKCQWPWFFFVKKKKRGRGSRTAACLASHPCQIPVGSGEMFSKCLGSWPDSADPTSLVERTVWLA